MTKTPSKPLSWFLRFALLLLPVLFFIPHTNAADYTVCSSGCDFVSLSDALQSPGLGTTSDTVIVDSTYVFDDGVETTPLYVPSNVTIDCEAGAGTLGNQASFSWDFNGGSNVTWQNCTFENMSWDFTNATNVDILNNTYTANQSGLFVFTNATDITFSGNTDVQRIQIQTAHDVVIENNTFACRFDNTCLYVGVAGGPDYSNPAEVSGNVLMQNNTITNYLPNNGGDWVAINGGNDIIFQNNTVRSAVSMNDVYLTMISIYNGQAEFKNNYIDTPVKIAPQNAATVPFNIRTQDYDTTALYEHNTIYRRNGDTSGANQNSCFTLFDGGGHPNIPINITARYNLCHQDGNTPRGQGFQLTYVLGSSDVTLIDSFNGFSNIAQPIEDSTNTITSVNLNTVTKNALLRLENVDTSDDFYPSPISVYLDVNGTTDIGAYSAARVSPILIDDDCIVDYITCHSNYITVLNDALKNGGSANIAEGTYPAFTLADFTGVTIHGAGQNTVIDGASGGFAAIFDNIQDSNISGFNFKNATTNSTTYEGLVQPLSKDGTDYNSLPGILIMEPGCSANPIFGDTPTDVTAYPGVGTESYNFFLVHIPGGPDMYYTIMGRASVLPDAAALSAMCGVPEAFIEGSLVPGFELNGADYTLNVPGMGANNITVTGGAQIPYITRNSIESAGLILTGSNDNTFSDIFTENNRRGVEIRDSSTGNTFVDSTLTGNAVSDIYASGTGNTNISQSLFTLANTEITSTGSVTVLYKARAFVKDHNTNLPVEGANVTFKDASLVTTGPLVTGSDGYTQYTDALPAMILTQSNPTGLTGGSKNPYTVNAEKTGYTSISTTGNLTSLNQGYTISLPPVAAATSVSGGGGSGGGGYGDAPTVIPKPTRPSGDIMPGETPSSDWLADFPGYIDLPKTDPDYKAFAYAYSIGAITGDAEGKVGSNLLLQRDQIAKMVSVSILNMNPEIDYCRGKAPFPDVAYNNWAARYICFAKAKGIITGYEGGADKGYFRPERTVSRAELVAILARALPGLLEKDDDGTYTDIMPEFGAWYIPYAAISHKLQLFPITKTFEAEKSAQRNEIARILYSLHVQGVLK